MKSRELCKADDFESWLLEFNLVGRESIFKKKKLNGGGYSWFSRSKPKETEVNFNEIHFNPKTNKYEKKNK